MALLQPAWLWGLLGLLVPLAIHLLHRRSQRPLLVGSLQAYRGGAPVQARRLRPNELWMLLLRCLLLALFVLLLARPVMHPSEKEARPTVFLAPELVEEVNGDSLEAAGFETRLLQPGIPLLAEGAAPFTTPYSYWDVFREIDSRHGLGDTVWLLFKPMLDNFSGRKPALSRTFVALPQPTKKEKPRLLSAVKQGEQSLQLHWWEKEQGFWRIRRKEVPLADSLAAMQDFSNPLPVGQPDTLRVMFHYEEAYAGELIYWQQAFQLMDSLLYRTAIAVRKAPAISGAADSGAAISGAAESREDGADISIWLTDAVPAVNSSAADQPLMLQLKKEEGPLWFERDLRNHRLYYIRHLLQEQMNKRQLLADFVPQLMALLPLPDMEERPPALLQESEWQPLKVARAAAAETPAGEPLDHWILLALVLLFILERWLSLRK
jgi:hypothetical protein